MIVSLKQAAACLLLLSFSLAALAENTNFTTSHFSGSGNCSLCHDRLTDTSGNDVSIVRDWSASMMANSAKDPFWQAKVATELERNPQLSALINDTCTECHAPMANYEITAVQSGEISLFGADGVLDASHALYDAAMNGVSCTLCHQIMDDASLGTLDGFSGHYNINHSKTVYGQYSDIFGQPMINNTGYTPTYSAHISDSALCATCHNLKTPFVDANGDVATTSPESEFPEQMPYTEWQNSIFGDAGSNSRSCQDCHLPKTTSKVSNRPTWLGARGGFGKHHLVGANTVILSMLRDNAAQLYVTSADLDRSIGRARDMLRSAASIEIVSAAVANGVLEAQVRVENTSGHKLPTSYPSRRVWIHFKVSDSNGNVLFESGRIHADGSISGADNDGNQSTYEPHHALISAPDQVQIYESVMGDSDGNITYTLLRGAQYLKDNRVTPKGFSKFNVPADVAVHGRAFDDADFDLGSDVVTYRIPVAVAGDLSITASLNYQAIAHGFLQDLYRDAHLAQVQTFKSLYEAQDLKYEQIASAQTTLVNDGGVPAPVPVVQLVPVPSAIDQGQSATLTWTSSDADTCAASGAWSGHRDTSGSETVSPSVTSTYTLSCTGDGGSASDNVTLVVNEPPTVTEPTLDLTASPASVARGGAITLSWNSTDAGSCVATGDWSGAKASDGTKSVTINEPATFTLTCSGEGGSVSGSVSYRARGRRWLELI